MWLEVPPVTGLWLGGESEKLSSRLQPCPSYPQSCVYFVLADWKMFGENLQEMSHQQEETDYHGIQVPEHSWIYNFGLHRFVDSIVSVESAY